MIKSKTEYMQAKLLALAFQRRFYGNGDRHPFYDCAVTELTYYLDAVSDLHGNRLGQKIARNSRKFLNEEPEEKRERKTYVLPLSQNQAYRIAEEIIKNDIPILTAYEIECQQDDEVYNYDSEEKEDC